MPFTKLIVGLVIFLFVTQIVTCGFDQTTRELVKNVKIINLQQQQLINKESTKIRYIIVTDKETFVCENSLLNGKFDNSDIFLRLKKDSTYNFKVCGLGKSWITDYRNILEVANKNSL